MSSPEEVHGLAFGFALLMGVCAVLLEVLARTVPATPGPRWWALACLLALPALALAGLAPHAAEPWGSGLRLLGGAGVLLALGALAEGLLRFGGRRGALRWAAGLALLYLVAGSVLALRAEAPVPGVFAAVAPALAWGGVALVALAQWRRGPGLLLAGVAACAALAGLGWVLRAQALLQAGGLSAPGRLLQADLMVLAIGFVACGLLVMLLVLAVSLRLTGQLRRESIRDPLTGALNRRGFEQHTARLAALSARLGQSVVVLMIDIDHFKQVNERHGHAVGDLALKSLAQLVQRAKRESDAFARLGGEEFCVVLPGTDVPGARVFADRLRRSFEAFEIDTGRIFLSCTISIGVAYASAATLTAGKLDLVDLLRQADEALYEAKRAGRNRVRFFASAEVMSSRLDSRLFTSTIPNPEP